MAAPTGKTKVRFQERAELLDFLLDVSAATSETLDLDRILANVAAIVKDVVPYDLFAILLYSERQHGLEHSLFHRPSRRGGAKSGDPAGRGHHRHRGRQHGSPFLSPTFATTRAISPALDAVQSELAVPMLARGKLVGVIDLQSTRLNAYREQDRALAAVDRLARRGLHRQCASVPPRRPPESHAEDAGASCRRSSARFSIWMNCCARSPRPRIRWSPSTPSAFCCWTPSAACCAIASASATTSAWIWTTFRSAKGITGAAAESREIVRVADTLADPRYIASHPDIRSEIAVPLMVQDRVVGVMDLESERMGYFTEEHSRLLALLAPQIASSVENARLYEEIAQREQRMDQDLKAARNVQSVMLPREAPGNRGPGDRHPLASGARDHRRRLRYLRARLGDTVFAFGDVSGKGAAAALYGAMVSGLLRTLAHRRRESGRTAEAAEQRAARAHRGSAIRHAAGAGVGARAPPLRHGQRGRRAAARSAAMARSSSRNVEGVPAGLLDDREYDEVVFDAAARRRDRAAFRRHHRSTQSRKARNTARGRLARTLQKLCGQSRAKPWPTRFSRIWITSTPAHPRMTTRPWSSSKSADAVSRPDACTWKKCRSPISRGAKARPSTSIRAPRFWIDSQAYDQAFGDVAAQSLLRRQGQRQPRRS